MNNSAFFSSQNDEDPEIREWLESFQALVRDGGSARAREVLNQLNRLALARRVNAILPGYIPGQTYSPVTDYINTIPVDQEPEFPGNEELERAYRRWVRWNAAIMVHRAQRPGIGVGGHISTYASSAALYEIGFNHFFKGYNHPDGADQVFFQGHASPGIYARSYLEGRLSEAQLDGFRQEKSSPGGGLPSYPHPRIMPEYWQFPTVSMGLGPINAIYQAQTNRYLTLHGLKDCSKQKVWAFLGDGEMDEVESRGQLQVAANDGLDNLIFVINCNLQRLDGPVRGNGKVIQELESFFHGAGWRVIKLIWGRGWDDLLARDTDGALVQIANSTLDGEYQAYKGNDGAYVRKEFFGKDPRCLKLVEHMSDRQIWNLQRGGHDYKKVYSAFHKAVNETDERPTVILAQTIKGYGLGPHFESRNATHQMKKLTLEDVKKFRDAMGVPISDAAIEANPWKPPYYHPGEDDEAIRFVHQRRAALGGYLPVRTSTHPPLILPSSDAYAAIKRGSGNQLAATTMALSRLLKDLFRSPIGKRIALIIPDEARTFGMDAYFPNPKIYNPHGQKYVSVDHDLLLSYKESQQGQILHVGINEAGALASFTATGTSYATHQEPLIPFYVFYSMFGFQRTADAIWAATDQMSRGFMIGATAGRTTLTGEGLQHNDGHSPLLAATNPAVVYYDPAFGYELAYIIQYGIERMYGGGQPDPNVIFYLTVYNEPIAQPAEPGDLDLEGLLQGAYRYRPGVGPAQTNILASGIALPWALKAQSLLAEEWSISADVWSVTSWNELAREGQAALDHNTFHPDQPKRLPYLTEKLKNHPGSFLGVSDYMQAVPEQIRGFIPGNYRTLGTDGFGFSDTRPAARRYFKVDAQSIVVAALTQLADQHIVSPERPCAAARRYQINNITAASAQ